MCLLETTLTVADGAGERAAHVAEELRFEQRFRNRAAVQGDEALHAARPVLMNRSRDDFLPRASLAGDQDCAVGGGDGLEKLKKPRHRAALADDSLEAIQPLVELRTQVRVLRFEAPLLETGLEGVQELVDQKRLVDEIPRAPLDQLHRVLHRGVPGDDNDDDLGIALERGMNHGRSVDAGKAQIGHDQVKSEIGEPGERSLA